MMNTYELKVTMFELITQTRDEAILRRLYQKMTEVFDLKDDNSESLPYALTAEQETELMLSLEESFDENNLLDISDAKKQHARWLK
jgi:replicative DNA helicase